MSAPPNVPASSSSSSSNPPKKRGRLSNFWFRVSEGRAVDDLWDQFVADARATLVELAGLLGVRGER